MILFILYCIAVCIADLKLKVNSHLLNILHMPFLCQIYIIYYISLAPDGFDNVCAWVIFHTWVIFFLGFVVFSPKICLL